MNKVQHLVRALAVFVLLLIFALIVGVLVWANIDLWSHIR